MNNDSQNATVLTILDKLDSIQREVQQLRSAVSTMAPSTPQASADVWQLIRARLAATQPELRTMSEAELRAEFERLSAKAATNLPYQSLEDVEHALSGDDYGLARH